MTLDEMKRSDRPMLTPYDISEVLGSDPTTIRMTARDYPERVRYPFTFTGNRMKVPRVAFIRWMEGQNN